MSELRAVKSAARVMEVMEIFVETQRPHTAAEIARDLGYPQSSTSMLLRTLEQLGYLALDTETGNYRPTLRVMLLGTWLHDELFGEGTLVSAMDRLRRETGQTVIIGIRQGLHVRSIFALRGPKLGAARIRAGHLYPVCRSSMGKLLLGLERDADVARIARASNALEKKRENRINVEQFVEEVRACRVHRWSVTEEYPSNGRAAVATLLPRVPGHPPMGLALGITMADLLKERNELIEAVIETASSLEAEPPVLRKKARGSKAR